MMIAEQRVWRHWGEFIGVGWGRLHGFNGWGRAVRAYELYYSKGVPTKSKDSYLSWFFEHNSFMQVTR